MNTKLVVILVFFWMVLFPFLKAL